MNNLFALAFVVVFLSGCWSYTWHHTNASLIDAYPAAHWDAANRAGGSIRGLD